MRILFFTETLGPGGKERQLVELIKGLNAIENIEIELVITKNEIHYHEIINKGIKIHILLRKFIKKDPRLFFLFYKIAKSFKPDVINTWGSMTTLYAMPTKLILGVPLVNSQIRSAPNHIISHVFQNRIALALSDMIISNSKAGIISYQAPKNRSTVIHNGFDFDRIEKLESKKALRDRLKIETKYIVGMVARFHDAKDYTTYISAANRVLKQNRNITFLCIGHGNFERFKKMVDPEMRSFFMFMGPQQNIESIMNVCDIGILSTYTEGISNVIMEFMALGKPVIATDGGGTSELVVDQKTGFLVKQKDPKELARKILVLLSNIDLIFELGQNARRRIEKYFKNDVMVNSYVEVFEQIVNS